MEWLRKGDGNNAFFFACVKGKASHTSLNQLCNKDGTMLTNHGDIEREVLDFYINLMGVRDKNLQKIGITAMRRRNQLNREERELLVARVNERLHYWCRDFIRNRGKQSKETALKLCWIFLA